MSGIAGFVNSDLSQFSTAPLKYDQAALLIAQDMNKMNLNPENSSIGHPGLGRGRGSLK